MSKKLDTIQFKLELTRREALFLMMLDASTGSSSTLRGIAEALGDADVELYKEQYVAWIVAEMPEDIAGVGAAVEAL